MDSSKFAVTESVEVAQATANRSLSLIPHLPLVGGEPFPLLTDGVGLGRIVGAVLIGAQSSVPASKTKVSPRCWTFPGRSMVKRVEQYHTPYWDHRLSPTRAMIWLSAPPNPSAAKRPSSITSRRNNKIRTKRVRGPRRWHHNGATSSIDSAVELGHPDNVRLLRVGFWGSPAIRLELSGAHNGNFITHSGVGVPQRFWLRPSANTHRCTAPPS
jgi:hypothetical protein